MAAPVLAAGNSPLDDPAAAAKIADQLAATSDALQALTETVRHETFEVKALAATLGADPAALRDWVAANTRPLAYNGTLKGAQGTLEDRAGNSLDRALLLAALLTEKGVEIRLVHAPLGADAAAALYAKTAEASLPRPKPDEAAQNAVLDKLASDPRAGSGATERVAAARKDAADRDTAAKAMAQTIIAALGAAVPAVAGNSGQAAAKAKAMAALTDHWWVQANIGGAWTDLDPDGVAAALAANAASMAPDAIPAALKHMVTLRVVGEFARDGKLTTQTLLEHPVVAAEVQGKLIGFTNRALDMTPMAKIDLTAAGEAPLLEAATAAAAWVPSLSDNDKVATDLLVTADGVTIEATAANTAVYEKSSPMGGMASAIDQIPGGGEPTADDGKPKAQFTAEWIEIEIATPGAPARLEKRMVFDAIGPAARASGAFTGTLDDAAKARRGLALIDSVDITVLTGAMAPDRATNRSAGLLALGFKATADWLKNGRQGFGPDYPANFRPTSFPLAGFAIGRDAYAPGGLSPRLTEANVALLRNGLHVAAGSVGDFTQFDIVANGADRDDPQKALAAGVADTVTEHVLLGSPAETTNTAARYAADLAAGKAWTAVAPGDAAALAALGADADTTAFLKADSARGYVVVAPAQMTLATATWWRVDPVSGETLGMTPLGGQEVVEEISTNMFVFGLLGTVACTVKAKNALGGEEMPSKAKVGGVLACYAGVLVGIMTFEGAAVLGLAIGAGGTLSDEVK